MPPGISISSANPFAWHDFNKIASTYFQHFSSFKLYFDRTFALSITRHFRQITQYMKHITQVLLLLLLGCQTVLGQSTAGRSDADTPERRPSEILIQISGELSVWRVIDNISGQLSGSQQIEVAQVVARDWGVYLLQYRNIADERQLLELVRRTPGVRFAQWNCRVPDRSTEPNDPEWWRQADMSLIGAPEAWDVSTGGLTPQGDTIVVAILEKGTMLSHPDLAPNRWHNWAEIPDNGIDDDNNGYVDDFGGWDARNDGDNPGANNHGTAVTGIVGARGNNSTGVTGVNWHVQLLNISNAEFESEIVAAYYYVGNMRKLYNTTNGAKGAFVVATNASFGLDREPAEDHPLWCATYDSLGKAGIIGVGATTNANTDVDAEGDMPTSCTSEFLITVNNTNQFGSKMPSTGFGKKSIDLGAPGNDTYTTSGTTTPDCHTRRHFIRHPPRHGGRGVVVQHAVRQTDQRRPDRPCQLRPQGARCYPRQRGARAYARRDHHHRRVLADRQCRGCRALAMQWTGRATAHSGDQDLRRQKPVRHLLSDPEFRTIFVQGVQYAGTIDA